MWEILSGDPDRLRAAVFYVLPVCATVLGAVGIRAWLKNEAGKRNVAMKMDMLNRGMSATDIERVLGAELSDARLRETTPYVKK
jgi:hypothetical protein